VIADTGPGFRDNPQDLVRPFFTRRPEGMGLGLYYANMVMELSGGRLLFPEKGDVELPEGFDGAVVALQFPEVQ
jgi:nitrogen fixation/metabolism regulation signal transduction histidine kinase